MNKQFANVQPKCATSKRKKNLPGTPMELKYCERCGNLWLRPSGADATSCASCASAEAAIAHGAGSFLQLWSRFRAGVQA